MRRGSEPARREPSCRNRWSPWRHSYNRLSSNSPQVSLCVSFLPCSFSDIILFALFFLFLFSSTSSFLSLPASLLPFHVVTVVEEGEEVKREAEQRIEQLLTRQQHHCEHLQVSLYTLPLIKSHSSILNSLIYCNLMHSTLYIS